MRHIERILISVTRIKYDRDRKKKERHENISKEHINSYCHAWNVTTIQYITLYCNFAFFSSPSFSFSLFLSLLSFFRVFGTQKKLKLSQSRQLSLLRVKIYIPQFLLLLIIELSFLLISLEEAHRFLSNVNNHVSRNDVKSL